MDDTARRPALLGAGLAVLIFGIYLAITPFSYRGFDDAKLVALMCGTFLVWLSQPSVDARFLKLGALWIGVALVAGAFGVDPVQSLTGTFWHQTGLLVWAACAYLLAVGARLSPRECDRVERWLLLAGLIVACLSIFAYFFGSSIQHLVSGFRATDATLGVQVTMIAVLAVSLAALVGSRELSLVKCVIAAAILGSGIAIAGQVSSLFLPFVALIYGGWRAKTPPLRVASLVLTVAAMLVVWPLLGSIGASDEATAAAQEAPTARQVQESANFGRRINAWSAIARGVAERPLLGWGPTNTGSAFLSEATQEEVQVAGRGFGDAHNLPLELLVTTGIVGFTLGFLPLAIAVLPRAVAAPTAVGWAGGAFVALGLFLMYEPIALATTPLLFLTTGIAAGRLPPVEAPSLDEWTRRLEVTLGIVLAAGMIFAAWNLAASTLHLQGVLHDSVSQIRASLAMEPWRLEAAADEAFLLSEFANYGDAAAAAEARAIMAEQVARNPWSTNARVYAAVNEGWLGNYDGALAWMNQHFARFPGDIPFGETTPPIPMPPGMGLPATTPP